MERIIFYFYICLSFISCTATKNYSADYHHFPKPYDTHDKQIVAQSKKTYNYGSIYVDNLFDGARLNDFQIKNDSTFVATILPENKPINSSPWYAFRLWSENPTHIHLVLDYENYTHRYAPKISKDGQHWHKLDEGLLRYLEDSTKISLSLSIDEDTLWFAAQEIVSSGDVEEWCRKLAIHPQVKYSVLGKSKQGRDLMVLDIYDQEPKGKKTVVVLARQHPPEVTGYWAMQHFVETILADTELAKAFRRSYRVMVFPLVNPDGVDMGHWRHNSGGVDLNRDWAYYRQTETRQIADYIVKQSAKFNNQVVLGLDFHSTYYDVYYTNKNVESVIPEFRNTWFHNLEKNISNFQVNEQPSEVQRPVSKSWFYAQFKAEGITYEIGDDTSQEIIALKGKVSAEEMMKIFIFHEN